MLRALFGLLEAPEGPWDILPATETLGFREKGWLSHSVFRANFPAPIRKNGFFGKGIGIYRGVFWGRFGDERGERD